MAHNKREKFVELAQKRTVSAIKAIRVLGNLSNRNAYEFGEADISKIVRALQAEVEAVRAKFGNGGSKGDITFQL